MDSPAGGPLPGAGGPAMHVGMVTANVRARGFYDRLGLQVIPVLDPGPFTHLGRPTAGPGESRPGENRPGWACADSGAR
ncbi:hypothetical protein ABZ570_19265 [Micromonospora sp. NPDC007271]|uniref:hypothetical protein n=1 Tax=Micromonospora sp. NPDC007271 TaxID=3154587 RepID=UPI0034073E1D